MYPYPIFHFHSFPSTIDSYVYTWQEKGNLSLFTISIEMPIWMPYSLEAISLLLMFFHCVPFRCCSYLFKAISSSIPSCSHLAFCPFTSGLLSTANAIAHMAPRGSAENQLEWAEPAPLNTSWSPNLWMWSLYFDIPCGSDVLMTGQSTAEVSYESKENVNMSQRASFLLRFSSVTSGRAAFSSSEVWWWYKNYKNMLSVSE